MAHLMALVSAAFPGEEAVLAHVEVEALQTAVSVIQRDSQLYQGGPEGLGLHT